MKPSADTIRAIGLVIARAACFDDRITDGDANRIRAWSEAVEPYRFDQADLLAAVTLHYQGSGDTMRVNDLIALTRKIRGERAEAEKGVDPAAALPPGDPQTGGLPIRTEGRPVWAAYEHFDAITRECPTCGAQPEESCVNRINNQTRRIPCLSRMRDAA